MHMNGKTRFTAEEVMALTEMAPVKGEHERRENLVIIPTYNEAINLKLLLPLILQQWSFDILVVDDNSPDGTGEVAEELARHFPDRVYVLHRPGKLGLSTAYIAGFHYALEMCYLRVFTMDADFSHDPNSLPDLRASLADADVALGSRYVPGGGTLRWPLRRRLLSKAGSAYARLLLGLSIRDLTGGFKGFRRQVLETLLPEMSTMRSNGYAFQIETTYLCSRHGFRIVEVPILFEDRQMGKSKMNRRIVIEALQVVLALRLSKGSVRTRRDVRLEARLLLGCMMAVVADLVGLTIILVAANIAPRWISQLVQNGTVQFASHCHTPAISPAQSQAKPFSPVQTNPHASSATIQLQGEDLTSNVPLSFAGSGFMPGEEVLIAIDNSQGQVIAKLSPVVADQTGHVTVVSETILSDLSPGLMYLRGEGERGHYWAQTSFRLHRIPPIVQLDTYSVKPTHEVGFSGSGFLPNEVVDVYLGSPGDMSGSTIRANAVGNIMGHFTVPLIREGDYTLFFVGRQSRTPISFNLSVQGFHPWVTLDTYALSPHMRLGFIGEDFVPGEEVLVYLNRPGGDYLRHNTNGSAMPVMHIQVDANGQFVIPAAWEVPEINGKNTLSFEGQQSGVVVTTTFTVMP